MTSLGNGRALGWLTSLYRYEVFGHGRYGDRRSLESEWLLSDAELDAATERIVARYRAMSRDDFLALPDPLSALFAWLQSGDEAQVKALVANATVADVGLLRVLEAMSNPVISGGGRYLALSRRNVEPFLDFDSARERVAALAGGYDAGLAQRAAILRARFEASD